MSTQRLAWIFVAALALLLPLLLPMRLLLPAAVLQRWSIGAADATGPVWHARLRNVRWHGQRLGDVDVRLRFWPLLVGRQQVAISTGTVSGTLMHGTRNGVGRLQGTLALDALPGLPVQLRFDDAGIGFAEGGCVAARGSIEAELDLPAALGTGPALALGGQLACDGRSARLQLLPLGDGASPLAGLRVDLRLDADGRYQAQALVVAASPATIAALQMAGFQPGPGGPSRVASGSLLD